MGIFNYSRRLNSWFFFFHQNRFKLSTYLQTGPELITSFQNTFGIFWVHLFAEVVFLSYTAQWYKVPPNKQHMSRSITKPNNDMCGPAKTQISLSIRPVFAVRMKKPWALTCNFPKINCVGRTRHFVVFVMLWLRWYRYSSSDIKIAYLNRCSFLAHLSRRLTGEPIG